MIEIANPGTSPHGIPLKYQPPIRAVTFGAVGEKQ
ncbi:pyridine nucleotide-disulfide oxidoreductase [Bacillus tropicus]|nr:pyridine nucleotide-disulfide oxidoreductase [Bacillus tropicus]